MSPRSRKGFSDLHLAFAQQERVVVGGRPADQDVVALGRLLHRVLRLQLAHAHGAERHVEVHVRVEDEPVVRDDGHVHLVRGLHDRGRGLAVVGHHQQHVDALGQQVLGLGVLERVVRVRGLHEHLRPARLRLLDDQVAVALPALLLEGVHREADADRLLPPAGAGSSFFAQAAPTSDRATRAGTNRIEPPGNAGETTTENWRRQPGLTQVLAVRRPEGVRVSRNPTPDGSCRSSVSRVRCRWTTSPRLHRGVGRLYIQPSVPCVVVSDLSIRFDQPWRGFRPTAQFPGLVRNLLSSSLKDVNQATSAALLASDVGDVLTWNQVGIFGGI